MHHRQREADRDRRIHRVAALPEDLQSRLGSQLMDAGDHGVLRALRLLDKRALAFELASALGHLLCGEHACR